jgi:dipeptidyl aminopeptidase/acylaminoacyl peptidase
VTAVEPANDKATDYFTDSHGVVRVMLVDPQTEGYPTGQLNIMYRTAGSRIWRMLGIYKIADRSGFEPLAVDSELNVVYGLKKKDGRRALYTIKLDESLHEELVYARDDVDIGDVVRIGRRSRIVGVHYATEAGQAHFFDPQIEQLMATLHRAVPDHMLNIVDESLDESKLLVLAASDNDPGIYYLFDRSAKQLQTLLPVRAALEGVSLAKVTPVTYPAADGVSIPAYLTLPPTQETARGLPAIVLPHGGPSSRDQWGFDWLAQFFANRGFAVLQPNYRGSSGYGDAWSEKGGFQSWSSAIGDVLAAGRWLVASGKADPRKLAIVGWSYGGYAALQSSVVDPDLFKAVIAIAPVTDLAALREEHRTFSDFVLVSNFIGSGNSVLEGSPVQQAKVIKAPVLLFHGAMDTNVSIEQSRAMDSRLNFYSKPHQLVTWDNLDHYLEDGAARAQMLRTSEEFLRKALGM